MTTVPPEITGHYVTVDGTRLYYDECGRGPTLFCIHTAGACSLEWQHFLPEMAKRGYRAIAIDLPGHGKSYPRNWEPIRVMHEYAEFVWKFIKAVCSDERPIVCGCSIGGNMTTDIACHHSGDMRAAIALEGGPYTFGDQYAKYAADWENPAWCPGWRDIIERGSTMSMYAPTAHSQRELRWQHRYAAQEIGTGDLQCWVNHDVRDRLKDISCPFLAYKGEADYWVPDEMLDATVRGAPEGMAEKAIGPKMGHHPMVERPEVLAEQIAEFLQRRGVGAEQ